MQRDAKAIGEPRSGVSWRVVSVLLIVGIGLSLVSFVRAEYDSYFFDCSTYILTARALAAGEGYTYLGLPFTLRPPGFSVMLAPLVAGEASFWQLNLFVSLFGSLLVLLVYTHFRERLGDLLAATVAVVLWINPNFQVLCNRVLSDVPGAALMMLVLALEQRVRKSNSVVGPISLALALGGLVYVRTIYALLIPAVLLARWLAVRAEPRFSPKLLRDSALLLFVPVLLLVPWKLRNDNAELPIPSEQTLNYSYETAVFHVDVGDPNSELLPAATILGRIPRHLGQMCADLGSRLKRASSSSPIETILGAISIACLAWAAWRHRQPGEFSALAMLFALSIAHATNVRLVMPIYLFALPAVLEAFLFLIGRILPRAGAQGAAACLLALLAFHEGLPTRSESTIKKHGELEALADYLDRHTSPTSTFAAWDGSHLSVYLKKPVVGLKFVARLDQRGGPRGALKLIAKNDVDYVIVGDRSRASSGRGTQRSETPENVLLGLLRKRFDPVTTCGPFVVFRTTKRK